MFGVNFFQKSNLKHKDAEVRLATLEQISPIEKELIFEMASEDPDPSLRIAAIAKLEDVELLEKLLAVETDTTAVNSLRDKLNRRYSGLVMSGASDSDLCGYVEKIDDEHLLATIACSNISTEVSSCAAARIKSKDQIIKVLRNLHDDILGNELLSRLDDEESLEAASVSSCSEPVRKAADEKLKELQHHEASQIQEAAAEETRKNSGMSDDLKSLIHEREKICENIENAVGRQDSETVRSVGQWKQEWEIIELLPPRYMEILDKRFKNACLKFEEGIKDAIHKVAVRKEKLGLLDDICIKAEALALREMLGKDVKLLHGLEESWKKTAAGLQDIELMESKFRSACERIHNKSNDEQKIIEDAVKTLKDSCDEIQNFISDKLPEKFKERRIELERIVKQAAAVLPDDSADKALVAEFIHRNKKYSTLLHNRYEARDFERWEHYTLKLDLCKLAEALLNVQDMQEVSDKLKELRDRWQKLGHVPPEKTEEIWQRFKAASDVLQQRCNEFFEKRNKEREETAQKKNLICEEAELLCNSTEWGETADKIKNLQLQWKEAGFCHSHTEKELYQRFRNACDIFFNARKVHYDSIRDIRDQNAQFKKNLCEEAERLIQMPHEDAHRKIKVLWDQWKKAGHAGKDESRLYERFRSVFDKYYGEMREERAVNMEKKQNLCNELEALLNSPPDITVLKDKVKQINDSWSRIGEVPRDKEDEIYRRFDSLSENLKKVINQSRREKFRCLITGQGAREKLLASLIESFSAGCSEFPDNVKNEWNSLGQGGAEFNWIENLFNKTCDAFAAGDKAFFDALAAKQPSAFKSKKMLCAELEQIAGCAAAAEEAEPLSNESLADELRMAFQNNFGSVVKEARPQDNNSRVKDIRSKWFSAGIAHTAEIDVLTARFLHADEIFSGKNEC
ncbi:MAG: DUF349 domain-containing protein [Victivallaceae bacterium]|jgi:hypothetical protein